MGATSARRVWARCAVRAAHTGGLIVHSGRSLSCARFRIVTHCALRARMGVICRTLDRHEEQCRMVGAACMPLQLQTLVHEHWAVRSLRLRSDVFDGGRIVCQCPAGLSALNRRCSEGVMLIEGARAQRPEAFATRGAQRLPLEGYPIVQRRGDRRTRRACAVPCARARVPSFCMQV
ncbi:hypothetical protein FKP32DRAFT_655758 [Trametes sanguinea]|nr:hypothetical protein FKP32DRAFT_655758 [Trametes sanguinea]